GNAQFACNFSNLVATLSLATAQLTVSGLNGPRDCKKGKFKACNKIQVNNVGATIAGVFTILPISTIVQNSGGLLVAILETPFPAGVVVGTLFTVAVTNPAVPCTGVVIGIV